MPLLFVHNQLYCPKKKKFRKKVNEKLKGNVEHGTYPFPFSFILLRIQFGGRLDKISTQVR